MSAIRLIPSLKDYLWGGTELKNWHKETDLPIIAESWEVSFSDECPTTIESGVSLKDFLSPDMIGTNIKRYPTFPLLVKLINSEANLSIQVHPTDDYAIKEERCLGKTETLFILAAKEGGGIYLGFNRDVTKEEVRLAANNGRITDLLNFFPAHPGDCFHIPSGTIHGVCSGITWAEVQQNSNITYRLYDYGRKDKNGLKRALAIDKALDVLDLSRYKPALGKMRSVLTDYYDARIIDLQDKSQIHATKESFVSVTFVEGDGFINDQPWIKGDSFFIPAGESAEVRGKGRALLVRMPD